MGRYDFSVNITRDELEAMLAYAKSQGQQTIGVHFSRGNILDKKLVSDTGSGWKKYKSHIDVTDYDSA